MVFAVSCGIELTNCGNDPLYNLVLVSHILITMAVHCTDIPSPHYRTTGKVIQFTWMT